MGCRCVHKHPKLTHHKIIQRKSPGFIYRQEGTNELSENMHIIVHTNIICQGFNRYWNFLYPQYGIINHFLL